MDTESFFAREELECKCGCGLMSMTPEFIELLNKTRKDYGSAMKITSGCRCENHNNKVGGAPDSWHLFGLAVDVQMIDPGKRARLIASAFNAGWRGIGVANTFIHLDMGTSRKTRVVWIYPPRFN